jgi:ABC-type uncharacterized transport system ATPase subunit
VLRFVLYYHSNISLCPFGVFVFLMPETAVSISSLSYSHSPGAPAALSNLSLELPKGSRTLLVGANGSGKTTLLSILAGKRMVRDGKVLIFGKDVFRDTPEVSNMTSRPVWM